MTETKPHPEWRILVEFLSAKDYGSEFTHADVATVLMLEPCSPRYYAQVTRARKHLRRDWQRELVATLKDGYRIVQPHEVKAVGRRQGVRAGRRLREELDIYRHAPVTLMAEEDVRKLTHAMTKVGGLLAAHRQVLAQTRPSYLPPAKVEMPKLLIE